MKSRCLLLALTLLAAGLAAQTLIEGQLQARHSETGEEAPLLVFTNGSGRIAPLHNGQVLEVGREYTMVAIPDPSSAFANWNPVDVFTFRERVVNPDGSSATVTNTVASPIARFSSQPALRFTMQPVQVIFNDPGVRVITRSLGWQANFDRRTTGDSQIKNLVEPYQAGSLDN